MNEGRGQDVAIAPFLKQSSNSAYSVPVPVVASTVSLGLPLPQGPEGTCVHVLNPPPLQDTVASSMWFSGYSVGMSPAESLPSCEGCLAWTIQAHKSAHNSMGWVLKPCYGHSQWPQDFPCMKEVWGHKLPKRNILADMRAMAFALCMVHKQQWMSSLSSCDHRLRLIEKLSFSPKFLWTLTLLVGRTIRGTRAAGNLSIAWVCWQGQAVASPWCCEGWLRLWPWGDKVTLLGSICLSHSGISERLWAAARVCLPWGDSSLLQRDLCSPFSAGLYKRMFPFLCLEIWICVPSYLGS